MTHTVQSEWNRRLPYKAINAVNLINVTSESQVSHLCVTNNNEKCFLDPGQDKVQNSASIQFSKAQLQRKSGGVKLGLPQSPADYETRYTCVLLVLSLIHIQMCIRDRNKDVLTILKKAHIQTEQSRNYSIKKKRFN